MSTTVDVIGWLNAQVAAGADACDGSLTESLRLQAEQVRDAVSELLAADRECDAALAARHAAIKSEDFHKAQRRLRVAQARRTVALARIGGAP